MKLVRPFAINETSLVSTSVAQSYPDYNGGTSYDLGDAVFDPTTKHVFESLQNANVGHALSLGNWWLDLGTANAWAMFDQKTGTPTTDADEIETVIQVSGRVDTLALLDIEGSSVTVTATTTGDGEVFNETYSLVSTDGIDDWYDYFFEEIERKPELIIEDFPNYSSPEITVTLNAPGETASIGELIIGKAKVLGDMVFDTSLGINDFSRKVADDFGTFTIVERPYSDKVDYKIVIPAERVDTVTRLLKDYRATGLLFIGVSNYGCTVNFGFIRNFTVVIANAANSTCSLETESLRR